jgi:hypothetical protein
VKFLAVKVPKNNEYTYEQTLAFFSSLAGGRASKSRLFGLLGKTAGQSYSFNILSAKQRIHFIMVVQDNEVPLITNQVLGQYSKAEITEVPPFKFRTPYFYELNLSKNNFLPIKTMESFRDVDPLASVLSSISRSADPKAVFWMQVVITPTSNGWHQQALSYIDGLSNSSSTMQRSQTQGQKNQISLVQEKTKYPGFKSYVRLLSNTQENLDLFYSAFNIYAQASGNSLVPGKVGFLKKDKLLDAINEHKPYGESCILNFLELCTIWHLPTAKVNVPNIVWGKKLTLEPPENLPVAVPELTEEEKQAITFLGKTTHKNTEKIFGIKKVDRQKHIYIVGKTGTGKSTLLENMAIDDIRKGEGVAVLDPHGDVIQTILDYIPKKRIKDVCVFSPADLEYSYPLNILEIPNPEQKELMVSGIISIFYKLYSHSWGPRLEHILRNVLFTLVNIPNTTLADVLSILQDKGYRTKLLKDIHDPYLLQFWEKEFDKMTPQQMTEAVSPILNKVGQFVTSPLIRRIVKHPKSKVKIEDIMNSGKILLCDLSQGKIGEDNATLLGSMIITQMQIAAMNRAYLPESQRRPFFLYVDEFQNFATSSFIKILSEARKYKLALTLANQYMTQIDEDVTKAILGNVGSQMTFTVGASDARILSQEFGAEIPPEDLTGLERFQLISRISIDNMTSSPFHGYTLPLPKNVSGQKEKIIEMSRRQFGVKNHK